jgi:hypothetical protein
MKKISDPLLYDSSQFRATFPILRLDEFDSIMPIQAIDAATSFRVRNRGGTARPAYN